MCQQCSLENLIFEAIEWEITGSIMTLTLNRPDVRNAINSAMTNELIYCLHYAREEKSIRVVIIAAQGPLFSAGADLKMLGNTGAQAESKSTVPQQGSLVDISMAIRSLFKPVIIKAQGPVMAGALLLTCNATHVLVSEACHFSAPEIKRGLWPYMVMASLFRVMPRRAGLDFIMRGSKVAAQQAVQWGLATQVHKKDELDNAVSELAQELASLAPETMQAGLKAFYHQENQTMEAALPDLQAMLEETLDSPNAKEGIAAFLEKREPKWD